MATIRNYPGCAIQVRLELNEFQILRTNFEGNQSILNPWGKRWLNIRLKDAELDFNLRDIGVDFKMDSKWGYFYPVTISDRVSNIIIGSVGPRKSSDIFTKVRRNDLEKSKFLDELFAWWNSNRDLPLTVLWSPEIIVKRIENVLLTLNVRDIPLPNGSVYSSFVVGKMEIQVDTDFANKTTASIGNQ